MFLSCNTPLQSISKIWLIQQLAVTVVFSDLKSFFDSLQLAPATALMQAELFLQDAKTGAPTFDRDRADMKKGFQLAVARFNRYGLSTASGFSACALNKALSQYTQRCPPTSALQHLLLAWARRAIDLVYADDVTGAFHACDLTTYLSLKPELRSKHTEEQWDHLLFDFWEYFTKALYFNHFVLKHIDAHPPQRRVHLNTLPLLAKNLDQERYEADFQTRNPAMSKPAQHDGHDYHADLAWQDIIKVQYRYDPGDRPEASKIHKEWHLAEGQVGLGDMGNSGRSPDNLPRAPLDSSKHPQQPPMHPDIFLGHSPDIPTKPFTKSLGRWHHPNAVSLGSTTFEVKFPKSKNNFFIACYEDFLRAKSSMTFTRRQILAILSNLYDLTSFLTLGPKLYQKLALLQLSRDGASNWDDAANAQTMQLVDTFLFYFYLVCHRQIERLSLSFADTAKHCLVVESDSSATLMTLKITILEYNSEITCQPIVKRRLYLTTCPACQELLTQTNSLKPFHCRKCVGNPHFFVNFQQLIADINLVPAKQVSIPLAEATSFLKAAGHAAEIKHFLTEEIKIKLPPNQCFFFVDSQALVLLCRSEPFSLSTRLKNVISNIQIKFQENDFCLFQNIFYYNQDKFPFGPDSFSKQPKGQVITQIRYLEKRLYTPSYLHVHPSQWGSFLSNTTLLPRLSVADLATLEINPEFYRHFLRGNRHPNTTPLAEDKITSPTKKSVQPNRSKTTYRPGLPDLRGGRGYIYHGQRWGLGSGAASRRLEPSPQQLGVKCVKRHHHPAFSSEKCTVAEAGYRSTLYTAVATAQIPDKEAFNKLLERKQFYQFSHRSAVHIIARVYYFIQTLRSRVQHRRMHATAGGRGNLGLGSKGEVQQQCSLPNCTLPCSMNLPVVAQGLPTPILYATALGVDIYSVQGYMTHLREVLCQMTTHGLTGNYVTLASALVFLILCCGNSTCWDTTKYTVFHNDWFGIQYYTAQGSIHKPLQQVGESEYSIATFLVLNPETQLCVTLMHTIHDIVYHRGMPYTAEALMYMANVCIPQYKAHMKRLLTACTQCRLAKAAKHTKNARIRVNIPHPTDLLGTLTVLDSSCTADFLTFYSPVQGYRFWVVVTLHHSLYCIAAHVPSYSSYHMLLTLMKLASQYNITNFHWDAAAQAVPIVNVISTMRKEDMQQVLSKGPGGALGRLLAPRKAGQLTLPHINIEMHLPRRHCTAGMAEKRISLAKHFLRVLQIDKDMDNFELDFTLQCAIAQINAMHTFQCKDVFLAPIHLRSFTTVCDTAPPPHLKPNHSTALDLVSKAREMCAMAMLQHKIHLLATPATEAALSCGVSAKQVTCGTVCVDLSFIREHHTIIGALCTITHVHKSWKGCIVYKPKGNPRYARRMFEELSFVCGPLRTNQKEVYKIFNLPHICVQTKANCIPGSRISHPGPDGEAEKEIDTENYTTEPHIPKIHDDHDHDHDQDNHENQDNDDDHDGHHDYDGRNDHHQEAQDNNQVLHIPTQRTPDDDDAHEKIQVLHIPTQAARDDDDVHNTIQDPPISTQRTSKDKDNHHHIHDNQDAADHHHNAHSRRGTRIRKSPRRFQDFLPY